MAKRRRYRSNVFRPKVKKPLSFELTKRGRKHLTEAMHYGEVSLGDLIEFYLMRFGAPAPEEIKATADRVAREAMVI